MSRIYFHDIESTAEVSGRERALLADYCSRALLFAFGDLKSFGREPPWILKHIPPDCDLHQTAPNDSRLVNSIETWLKVGFGENAVLLLDGERIPLFRLQLNSASAMGGNALRLAARLHGQCELHCYVEGPNRNWLADLIEDALDKAIFRPGQGWEDTCEMLRGAGDRPVVCSYSGCESFPNRHVAAWEPDEDDEDGQGWYDLPHAKRWELALAGLRSSGDLELRPDRWDDFHFGAAPVSGFDFYNRRAPGL